MKLKIFTKLLILPSLFMMGITHIAGARDYIRVVGSSTVYPFTTVIGENFADNTGSQSPIIEANGTGGGMKLFCGGIGQKHPDFSNASRQIKNNEIAQCKNNGIKDIIEIKIGYDGIVLANSKDVKPIALTKKQLFLALADKIPANGKLIKNNYKLWSEIDKSLPKEKIYVYGPPPTSGTRDAFVELVLQEACVDLPEFIKVYTQKKKRKKACHIVRSDGHFIEVGENDNLIVQKLRGNIHALGIFGFSFLKENPTIIQAVKINGVMPTFDNIVNGSYSVSRPLFIYLKKEHLKIVKGMKQFAREIVSDDAIGEDGYLLEKGLIPMNFEELNKIRKKVLNSL